jgi:hypothetical protein
MKIKLESYLSLSVDEGMSACPIWKARLIHPGYLALESAAPAQPFEADFQSF